MELLKRISAKYLPLLLVTALPFESKVVLQKNRAEQIFRRQKTRLFRFSGTEIYLLETGMGNRLKDDHLLRQIQKVQPALFINYGICGSLDSRLEIKSVFRIDRVCSKSEQPISLHLPPGFDSVFEPAKIPAAHLLTVEQPVLQEAQRENLFRKSGCPLVDMEGYFLAKLAEKLSRPLIMIKLVSDSADEQAVETVRKNKQSYQKILRKTLLAVFSEMSAT